MTEVRKRQDAPGALEHVRAFVNTRDVEEDTEALDAPEALVRWLEEHELGAAGMTAGPAALRRAVAVREALRAVLLGHADGAGEAAAGDLLDAAARRGKVRVSFAEDGSSGVRVEADGVDGALGRLLALVHEAQADGTWPRLKACGDPGCQWAFYDHTKNRSGRWCTMAECGNRAKARTFRERRAGAA
jgi:predicted RNA-binding Zn ribbon-like protein